REQPSTGNPKLPERWAVAVPSPNSRLFHSSRLFPPHTTKPQRGDGVEPARIADKVTPHNMLRPGASGGASLVEPNRGGYIIGGQPTMGGTHMSDRSRYGSNLSSRNRRGRAAAPLKRQLRFEQLEVRQLLTIALPGDYKVDASVDAADYVLWRKT